MAEGVLQLGVERVEEDVRADVEGDAVANEEDPVIEARVFGEHRRLGRMIGMVNSKEGVIKC